MSENRIAIWVETGGYLSKDRRLFYFGKRVESVCIKNSTAATVTVAVDVARDSVFYLPPGPQGSAQARTEITQQTYFYLTVPAGGTVFSPPFFADRGLVLRRAAPGTGVWGGAEVYGVNPGDCATKGQIKP